MDVFAQMVKLKREANALMKANVLACMQQKFTTLVKLIKRIAINGKLILVR